MIDLFSKSNQEKQVKEVVVLNKAKTEAARHVDKCPLRCFSLIILSSVLLIMY